MQFERQQVALLLTFNEILKVDDDVNAGGVDLLVPRICAHRSGGTSALMWKK